MASVISKERNDRADIGKTSWFDFETQTSNFEARRLCECERVGSERHCGIKRGRKQTMLVSFGGTRIPNNCCENRGNFLFRGTFPN